MNPIVKVFCSKESPLFKTLCFTFQDSITAVGSASEADAIFISDNMSDLWKCYTKDGVFIYCASSIHQDLALLNDKENVVIVGDFMSLKEFPMVFQSQLIPLVEASRAKKSQLQPLFTPEDLVVIPTRYRVLVVDDDPRNLEYAKLLLGEHHHLQVADGLKSGMAIIEQGGIDFLLTDMELRPDNYYPSYSVTSQRLGEPVLFGWAIAVEATERGIPTAIVTDGNHHTSWVVAMFNKKTTMTMNGQTVCFFTNIRKRWDRALEGLMVASGELIQTAKL